LIEYLGLLVLGGIVVEVPTPLSTLVGTCSDAIGLINVNLLETYKPFIDVLINRVVFSC
jgi:hypothetical protein